MTQPEAFDPDRLTPQQELRMKAVSIIEHARMLPREKRTLFVDHIVASGVARGFPRERAPDMRQRLLDYLHAGGLL